MIYCAQPIVEAIARLAQGVDEAVVLGGRGGEAHTPSEWFDNGDGPLGIARALTIVIGAAGLAV